MIAFDLNGGGVVWVDVAQVAGIANYTATMAEIFLVGGARLLVKDSECQAVARIKEAKMGAPPMPSGREEVAR